MEKLQFLNPVFNDGMNLTVRKGNKWDKLVSVGDTVELVETHSDKSYGKVQITGKMCVPFWTLNNISDILYAEHDPLCRTYSGLQDCMGHTYPGFTDYDVVTLLFFERKA